MQGRIGIAHNVVKVRDKITLSYDSTVPIVLREEEGLFLLMGHCYLYGLMDGEGLLEARKQLDATYDMADISWLQQGQIQHLELISREFTSK
jgi:hypothetical protein